MCGNTFNMTETGITKGYAIFQTLQTWVSHDGTVYLNLNSLPQALPYIFYQLNIDRL